MTGNELHLRGFRGTDAKTGSLLDVREDLGGNGDLHRDFNDCQLEAQLRGPFKEVY